MPLETDREKCAHLLRRFGLGASEAELNYYLQDGLSGAIDRLLDDSGDDGFHIDPERFANAKGQLQVPVAIDWWIGRMIMTRRPLREKMALFWHNHFATSAEKVQGARLMLAQNETLRRNGLGRFQDLLTQVSKDPAMILWLDNQLNVKGHPNENFAREVMELFTLGIGHYTEKDVQEGARAFTGFGIQRSGGGNKARAEFAFRADRHDEGTKTFLGSTGNFTGDDVLHLLCGQPRTAEFLTHKVWEWFVWTKPDDATIAPFAQRFRDSGLDIKSLLRDIMRSTEFYSPKAERGLLKNPVDFCIATLRQLGIGQQMEQRLALVTEDSIPRGVLAPAQVAQVSMKGMGMWLMYPPDVSGWRTGEYWITSATMVERIGWADYIFGRAASKRAQIRYPAYALFDADRSPAGVVKTLASIFDAPLKPAKLPELTRLAQKSMAGGLTAENASVVSAQVARLIFAAPEFQFA